MAEFVIGDTKLEVLEEPVVAEEPTNPYSPWNQTIIYAFIGLLIELYQVLFTDFSLELLETGKMLRNI